MKTLKSSSPFNVPTHKMDELTLAINKLCSLWGDAVGPIETALDNIRNEVRGDNVVMTETMQVCMLIGMNIMPIEVTLNVLYYRISYLIYVAHKDC